MGIMSAISFRSENDDLLSDFGEKFVKTNFKTISGIFASITVWYFGRFLDILIEHET